MALGLGLIGAGKHGVRYARHIVEDVDGAALVALCRRNRAEGKASAREYGCAYHAEWRALIDDPKVDAIVAAVPPALNVPIAEAAAAARKPMLLEKPVAVTVDAGRQIVEAAARAGVVAMVAQTLRYDATVAAVKASLAGVAPVHAISIGQRFEPSVLDWLDDPTQAGGGIVLHTGIHSIDLLRVLSGDEVAEVSCLTSRVMTKRTEDNFVMHARLVKSGALAQVFGSRAMAGRCGPIEIAGAGGHIFADHVHREAWVARGREREALAVAAGVATVAATARDFVATVRNGTPPPITLEDGLRAVAVVEACYRSAARDGAPERVTAL